MVLKLEELLHYFHVCCKAAVAVLGTEHQQDAFLANVDVCAAEAFVTASEKFTLLEMQNHLLTATQTYHDQLAAVAEPTMPQTLDKNVEWVVFKQSQENKKHCPNGGVQNVAKDHYMWREHRQCIDRARRET